MNLESSRSSAPFRRRLGARFAKVLEQCPVQSRQEFDNLGAELEMPDDGRFRRFIATTPEIKAGISQLITGDGPGAQFKFFIEANGIPEALPYKRFRHSLKETFRQGWRMMEARFPPEEIATWRAIHHTFLDRDSVETPISIDETVFARGVELPEEMAYFGVMFGIAASKDEELRHSSDNEQLLDVARGCMPLIRARMRMHLRQTFGLVNYYPYVDFGNAHFERKSNGARRLICYDLYSENEVSKEELGLTVGCPADLIKFNAEDQYTVLENTVFAAINKLHEYDLLRPEAAIDTWTRRMILEEQLKYEQIWLAQGLMATGGWRFMQKNLSVYRDRRRDVII